MEQLIMEVRQALTAAGLDGEIAGWRPVPGGHSGITIAVDVAAPTSTSFVVKAAPAGAKPVGRNDVLRQAQILRALEPTVVRCPKVLASQAGDRPFFVMEYLDGDATEPVLDEDGDPPPGQVIEERVRAAIRELISLHDVDRNEVGLGGESVLSLGDELGRWTTTMAAIDPELSHGSDRLRILLEQQQSDTTSTSSLVHGDFRLGNVMFLGTDLTGVVDWEIWSVADPRIDLGWLLLFCDHTYFPGVSRPARGMPSTSELLAEYARLKGNPIEGVDWFLAFACYKMAAIMGDNLRRHRNGRHVDPYQERLPPTIQNLIQRGLSKLEGGTGPTG